MTASGPDGAVAEAFEEQRGRLEAVAYRMLGSRADAEDAVQEAWLRLARQDTATVDNLAGWLTTVVGRVCVDLLRTRRAKPETSYADRLPDLVVTEYDAGEPEDEALLADSVGLALLVVLDTLGPAERLAFVLHDMFAVPFEEIGQIVGRSTDATKMLASRARRKVRGTHRPASAQRQRAVVDAFHAAARSGDFEGLLRYLDPEVALRTDTPRGVVVTTLEATEMAARTRRLMQAGGALQPVLVNGEPGIVVWRPDGRPLAVMACTVADDRIVEMLSVRDPARLAELDLPERPT